MARPVPTNYRPRNISKYQGDPTKIVARSSWEKMLFKWLDEHPCVIGWSSEETIVPYYSPLDEKQHRYFIDAKVTFKYPNGTKKTYLVEVKPYRECFPSTARNQKRLVEETSTYITNQAKWAAAREYAKKYGWEFVVVTEKELFGDKK